MGKIIYGPVSSWRLGKSLGIDLLSTPKCTCSFDCIYCQLGKTARPLVDPIEFVNLPELTKELSAVKGIRADYATFSGMGEPTLAANLGEAIELAKSILKLPVAVLTNSSLLPRADVREKLALADVVVAKVDAPDDNRFRAINRPFVKYTLDEVLGGLRRFRSEYGGRLALQMMFVAANRDCAARMAAIAEGLSPDEVQINTPLRPCGVRPLTRDEILTVKGEFAGIGRIFSVYEASKPEIKPLQLKQTLRRRPKL